MTERPHVARGARPIAENILTNDAPRAPHHVRI